MPTTTALTGHDCTPRAKHEIRDTDLIALDRELHRRLADQLVPLGSCLVVANRHTKSIYVTHRVGRTHGTFFASIVRVAWALAHPEDHLTEEEFAVHTCQNTGGDAPLCCLDEHLRKGTRDDWNVARAARKRGFLDR
jgi:hypothetical protein